MDVSERKITKIAREASNFTAKVLRDTGLGLSEFEFVYCVRHNPGISQESICEKLAQDKAAIARRAANLEKKGYIQRRPNPGDGRGKQLFATEKANSVKNSKVNVESYFYEWLMEDIPAKELDTFLSVLDKIYMKSKNERRAEFKNLIELEKMSHGEP